MKVAGIAGSPRGRNSSTLRLMVAALEGAESAGATVEIIDLAKLRIGSCKSCGTCYRTGKCVLDDDFGYVVGRIEDADGIVLGSPAYFDGVTARMETLMDRMSDAVHCQRLQGKYGCSVCTTGNRGEARAIGHMNDFLVSCGAFVTGGGGAWAGSDPHALDIAVSAARTMGTDLVAAIREKRVYADQADRHRKAREQLADRVRANKDSWAHDYQYWMRRGWL